MADHDLSEMEETKHGSALGPAVTLILGLVRLVWVLLILTPTFLLCIPCTGVDRLMLRRGVDPSVPRTTFAGRLAGKLLRLALRALGGAFIKFGQVIAQQPKLVGYGVANALRGLQDDGRRRSKRFLMRRLAKLPADRRRLADLRDVECVASASTAAVFRARWNSRDAAFKVILPSARLAYGLDRALLRMFAAVTAALARVVPLLRRLNAAQSLRNFADAFAAQLDLRDEAAVLERMQQTFVAPFNALLASRGLEVRVAVPQVMLAKHDLLVMEWAEGERATRVLADAASRDAGRRAIAARYRSSAETVIEAAIFMSLRIDTSHGDLHAGNVLFAPNKVWLLDYGLVSRLNATQRARLAAGLLSLSAEDAEGMARQFKLMAPKPAVHTPAQHDSFVADVRALVAEVHAAVGAERAAGGLPLGALLKRMLFILKRHGVQAHPGFVLLDQNLIAAQGFVGALAPDYDLVGRVGWHVMEMCKDLLGDPDALGALVVLLPSVLARLDAELKHGREDTLQALVAKLMPLATRRSDTHRAFAIIETLARHLPEDILAILSALPALQTIVRSKTVQVAELSLGPDAIVRYFGEIGLKIVASLRAEPSA